MLWSDVLPFAATLVGDVLYGISKEVLRVGLVASGTLVVQDLMRPALRGQLRNARERVKVLCAVCFLGSVVSLAYARCAERCAAEESPSSLCKLLPAPPPPPPPPPPTLLSTAVQASERAIAWTRRHPLRLAATVGALLLADLLNVFISLDRLDPLVRVVAAASRPVGRAARAAWRWVVAWRGQTLLGL